MTLALNAHDNKKEALIAFAKRHLETLRPLELVATGIPLATNEATAELVVGSVLTTMGD